MTIFDPFEFTPGVRYRHNKTDEIFILESVEQRAPTIEPVATIRAAAGGGRTFRISPATLRNLYSEVEADDDLIISFAADPDDNPGGRLAIGSITIDAIDPEPGPPDPSPELNFRRSGRPVKPTTEIRSYFGTPLKYGPRKKENE